ncbi:hypothetical protein V1264_003062 [Littorina saxatilis]|uniref:Uncharacterized protein n=1 Tax=Littorina saxatilis TaxID=31220 RepID=A0AAN9G8G4_9CAEN
MAQTVVYRWLFLGALLSLTVCQAAYHPAYPALSAATSSGMIPFNFGLWLGVLRDKINLLKTSVEESKRSCNGFPCMYTHLGAKAGRQAMMRSLMGIIHSCAHDPTCSPGKRRKRSSNSLLSVLRQRRNTS